jgi:hypothetical protein
MLDTKAIVARLPEYRLSKFQPESMAIEMVGCVPIVVQADRRVSDGSQGGGSSRARQMSKVLALETSGR